MADLTLDDFGDICTAVRDLLGRKNIASSDTDFEERIPLLITLAEQQIGVRCEALALRTTDALATVAGTATLDLSTLSKSFKRDLSLQIDGFDPLKKISDEGLRAIDPDYGPERPSQYSILGRTVRLWPTPDAIYNVNVSYVHKPTPLTSSNTTNELVPDEAALYLYGALMEACSSVRDNAGVQKWAGLFGDRINALNDEAIMAEMGEARTRQRYGRLYS